MAKHTHTSSIIRTEEGWETEWKVAVIHTSAGWYIVYRLIIQYKTQKGDLATTLFLFSFFRICIFVSGGGGPLVFLANDLPKKGEKKRTRLEKYRTKKERGLRWGRGLRISHFPPSAPLPLVVVVVLGSAKSRMVTNWYNKKRKK